MSEYQYYEFQALDRRLTTEEMRKLRAFSTRASITPTSFVNTYEWGDFRGDENAWMEKYFDAFLYFANWGTRVLMLRVSSGVLDRETAKLYCAGESTSVREHKGNVILTFNSDEEEEEHPEEEDALAALIPIRAQLARGDLRSLYIGWLRCAQTGELEDEETEPPVPAGLGELDGTLERMVDFLRVDPDLLAIAAAASPPLREQTLTREAIRAWIAGRPAAEKDDYLERFIAAEEPVLAAELQRLIGGRNVTAGSGAPRTVGELLHAGREAADERERAEAARAEAERKRRQEEEAAARSKYLGELARREPAVWREIADLIATKQPASYDRAVGLLVDLREIAAAEGRESGFRDSFTALRMEHARKPSLIAKFERAGLR
jgi:hypothetical protein